MHKLDYYQSLLRTKAYLDSRQEKAGLISRIISNRVTAKTANIVDLGSGSGIVKSRLEEEWGRPIIGIEYDRPFIANPANTCVGDVSEMPFKSGSIDLAICNHLLEHVERKGEFVLDLKRVLKPDGFIYLTICNKYKLIEPHYRLPFLSWLPKGVADLYLRITGRGSGYQGITFYSYRDLTDMFRNEGFKIQNITWEAIVQNTAKMRFFQRAIIAIMGTIGPKVRNIFINNLSPQWFLIITK
ncbi:MAG: class I SAM-dependent methyltransferase [Desulfocucumaceae bacterium]